LISCPSCKAEAYDDTDRFCRNCGAIMHPSVPRNVQIGRKLVIVSVISILVLDISTSLYELTVASITSSFETVDCINDLISGSIEVVLFYLIFQGYAWARWLMGLFALLGTVVSLVFLALPFNSPMNIVILLLMTIGIASNAYILLFASSVRAFQHAQKQARLGKRSKAN
jgi:uncharacterized integral membrane protein